MDDNADKPKRRWPTYLAIVSVILLVIYPLSAGPTVVVAGRLSNGRLNEIARAFYLPLYHASVVTGTWSVLDAYIDWCCEVTNTERV